jgi:hypothetical protein
MNINEWLSTHEAISLHWIENKLSLSPGTIRKGRNIPERYIKDIETILKDYGYSDETSLDKPKQTIVSKPIEAIQKTIKPVVYNNKVSEETKTLKQIQWENYKRNNNIK